MKLNKIMKKISTGLLAASIFASSGINSNAANVKIKNCNEKLQEDLKIMYDFNFDIDSIELPNEVAKAIVEQNLTNKDGKISREELVAAMADAIDITGYKRENLNIEDFNDAKGNADFTLLRERGILVGDGMGNAMPEAYATINDGIVMTKRLKYEAVIEKPEFFNTIDPNKVMTEQDAVDAIEYMVTMGRYASFMNENGDYDMAIKGPLYLNEIREGVMGGVSMEY